MNYIKILLSILFFVVAVEVNAQQALIERLDKNNDGKIEQDEMPRGGPLVGRFDDLDCDKSGKVTSLEFKMFFRNGKIGCVAPENEEKKVSIPDLTGGKGLSARAKSLDANGDGLLQKNEAKGRIKSNFVMIDCDKNGGLDGVELKNFVIKGKGCKKEDISSDKDSYHAHLILPKRPKPYPVIVVSHGMGGNNTDNYDWANKFAKWGFAAIVMDHYSPRGYKSFTKRPGTNESFKWRRDDLISLLKIIKKDERLDNTKVTLSGWSRGAGLVMHGISDPDVREEAGFNPPIKSAILFYPQSSTIFKNFKGKIDIPTLFITGEDDYIWWSPTHGWKTRLDEYKSSEHPFILKIYKGATHAFDRVRFKRKRCRDLPDGQHCMLYDEGTHKQSIEDFKTFLIKYGQ
jgi:dienelactone hydrolase